MSAALCSDLTKPGWSDVMLVKSDPARRFIVSGESGADEIRGEALTMPKFCCGIRRRRARLVQSDLAGVETQNLPAMQGGFFSSTSNGFYDFRRRDRKPRPARLLSIRRPPAGTGTADTVVEVGAGGTSLAAATGVMETPKPSKRAEPLPVEVKMIEETTPRLFVETV